MVKSLPVVGVGVENWDTTASVTIPGPSCDLQFPETECPFMQIAAMNWGVGRTEPDRLTAVALRTVGSALTEMSKPLKESEP